MRRRKPWAIVALVIVGLHAAGCAERVVPPTTPAARVEAITGSNLTRIVLTDRAAKRLDIQTVPVREEQVTRKRVVGGQVVAQANRMLIRVRLIGSDLQAVDPRQPAGVAPLTREPERPQRTRRTFGADGRVAVALPIPREDGTFGPLGQPPPPGGTAPLDYVLEGTDHGFAPGQAVLVELALRGGGMRKVIPYSAVIYDVHGETWTYTSPEPLVFIRHRIAADYIDGDQAVLSDGPPVGTPVVAVGATELFGTEFRVGT